MIHALLTSELSWQQNNVFYLPLYFSVLGIFFRNRLRELVLRLLASIITIVAKVVPLFFSHKVSNHYEMKLHLETSSFSLDTD